MKRPLNLLLLEDNAADARLLIFELDHAGFEVAFRIVSDEPGFLAALDSAPEVILADYSLPEWDVASALLAVKQRELDIPFIIVSGAIGEEAAVAAMRAGAHDYLLKDNLARLAPAVERELREAADRVERRRVERQLREHQDRFRVLAENLRDVFWMTSASADQVLYVSPGYELIWRRPSASLYDCPESWFEAVHPADRDRVAHAALAKRAGGNYDEEYRIVRPDGSIRWIHDRAFPVVNPNGTVQCIVGFAHDVTERREILEELRHRTGELDRSNATLQRFNRLAVGRELRMVELKREINLLREGLGELPDYNLEFATRKETVEPQLP